MMTSDKLNVIKKVHEVFFFDITIFVCNNAINNFLTEQHLGHR